MEAGSPDHRNLQLHVNSMSKGLAVRICWICKNNPMDCCLAAL